MKTYKVLSRYKAAHKFIKLDENTFQFYPHKDDSPYMRSGFNEQGNIEFIDPPGGPFIRVGYSLNELVNNKMPDRNITEIKWDEDHYKLILDSSPRIKER